MYYIIINIKAFSKLVKIFVFYKQIVKIDLLANKSSYQPVGWPNLPSPTAGLPAPSIDGWLVTVPEFGIGYPGRPVHGNGNNCNFEAVA